MRAAALLVLLSTAAMAADPTCAELADAGVPAPPTRIEPGWVATQPAWVLTPAAMCDSGKRLAACEASDASRTQALETAPAWWLLPVVAVVAAGAGLAVGLVIPNHH